MIAVIPRRSFTWTGAAMEARAWPVNESAPPWRVCGWCGGQREFWEVNEAGYTVGPTRCPRCLGIGDVPAVEL